MKFSEQVLLTTDNDVELVVDVLFGDAVVVEAGVVDSV